MLASAINGIRLSIHVLVATVWVGGQITLAGMVPSIKKVSAEAITAAAAAFGKLSWPAFWILVITGFWNIGAVNMNAQSTPWKVVLYIKIAVVILSGGSAFLHAKAKTKKGLAAWGALSSLSAVSALVMGVFLAN